VPCIGIFPILFLFKRKSIYNLIVISATKKIHLVPFCALPVSYKLFTEDSADLAVDEYLLHRYEPKYYN
jgi:hypothetical protein